MAAPDPPTDPATDPGHADTDAGSAAGSPPQQPWQRAYWRANLRLMVVLLAIWFTVSFGFGILLVEPLNNVTIAGFPLGFWFAQQGSIYTFVILIGVYALRMDRVDDKFGVSERDDEGRRL